MISEVRGSSRRASQRRGRDQRPESHGVRYHSSVGPPRQPTASQRRLITPVTMILAILALALLSCRGRSACATRVDAVALSTPPNAVRIERRAERRRSGRRRRRSTAFVQREPPEGGEPSQRTEFRVAYDATTLFVKVRAFDTEPDKIVSYLTRRDVDSPVGLDPRAHRLVPRQRTAYEFARQPVGRQAGSLLVQRQQPRRQLGRGVGREGLDATSRAGRPNSGFRSRSCASIPAASNTFGFAVSRQIGRLNETSTWPLLARSANGYVSSFGELGGLSMAASPKRLEMLPYSRGRPDAAADRRQPADRQASATGAALGMDMKYAITPGLTLTAHDQSGLRPGGSRSRGREPDARSRRSSPSGGRSSSKAPAPSASASTAWTGRARTVLLAPHRPRAAGRPTICRAATTIYTDSPVADDDPRRRRS